ncbi:hypothetical protein AAA799P11_01478 [Marine Group I thaumarchaeote SCGC AAA799-P11]|uniref:Uncharacterized protein n=1 Tax=Marine Group I thaumarchaeote SCGC AAA799-P11 TaxID=1502295 RepID=A0A087RQJ0_9ARCH|nr:hypothetical protein AAA799P11_01478 [Marine Group I thaumarchaeote SCGC AAA799-P11]
MKGERNAVIIEIIPIRGNKKVLTAPISTPALTITIENSPLGAPRVNAERRDLPRFCLNKIFPIMFPPNFIPVATAINAIAIQM